MSRCTGHCCRAFVLNRPYQQLLEWGREGLRKGLAGDAAGLAFDRDTIFVVNMLIPLDIDNMPPDAAEAMGEVGMEAAREHGSKLYTCKHLDRETGDCRVYESRPKLCRDYPNHDFCNYHCKYPGCTARPEATGEEKPCGAEPCEA